MSQLKAYPVARMSCLMTDWQYTGCASAGLKGAQMKLTFANFRLMQRDFELLGQIRGHVVCVFDGKQVSAEILIHKLSRKL